MRRVLLAALLVVGAAAGCSSSDDAAPTTTTAVPTSTTTTIPPLTDEEIIANINEELRPGLESAFDAETADCVIGILEEAGTGTLLADDVVPEYQSRCGVNATEVTGVITAAALVRSGATEAQGLCVAEAIGKLGYDEVAAMGEDETNALYETCGIEPAALTPPD